MSHTLQTLFDSHAISSFAKQMRLNALVGEDDWGLDLDTATLSFSSGKAWKIQLLGSESYVSNTWRWAWANEKSGSSPGLMEVAERVRKFGEAHDIDELTQPDIPLDWGDGHMMGLIAVGICDAPAYYRCPHDHGAVFVVIDDPIFPQPSDSPLGQLPKLILDAVSSLEIHNQRLAVTEFLKSSGVVLSELSDRIEATSSNGPITIKFDSAGRISEVVKGKTKVSGCAGVSRRRVANARVAREKT